jgi:5-methyltetrahydropteroyltriglutamate--homocysteine methyltransferase
MELILANNSSYPRIGESAEYQSLRRTIAQWEKGERTDSDLRAAEDRMTEMALAEQTAAGLDVITDGQIRWYDPVSHLAGKLEGVRINGLLRFFDTNFYFRQPVIHSKVMRTKALIVEEFLFAKAWSSRPVKPVLTGALTLARLSLQESGKARGLERLLEEYSEALAAEVAALAGAGAGLIQVDEPSLLRHPADVPLAARSLATLAAAKGTAQLALSVYFGDPAPIYTELQKLPVDVLGLDFTYSSGLVDVIEKAGSGKALALGLVDGRNTRLEDAQVVARDLERMLPRLPGGRAILCPSCGLEYLPRDRAQLKLKHLSTIKKTFLGSDA